jgi:hypothetical protein
MEMKNILLVFFLTFIIIAGCSSEKRISQTGVSAGKDTVAILFKQSTFKSAVIDNVEKSLKEKNIKFVRDDVKNSGNYKASDYHAVIFMADYQAWHTPLKAKKYFHKNGDASNIIFFITAGDPKVKIKKPFDAVTSASKEPEIGRVSSEIITRIEALGDVR